LSQSVNVVYYVTVAH